MEFEAVVQYSTVANPRHRVDQKQALIGAGEGVACVVGAEQINRGVAAATARLAARRRDWHPSWPGKKKKKGTGTSACEAAR